MAEYTASQPTGGRLAVPPYSIEAEQSVLGAIILEPNCITTVLDYLNADSFYSDQNKRIFSCMSDMFATGRTLDFVTLLDAVEAEHVFRSEGDAKVYLTRLAEDVPTASNVEAYAAIVQEKFYLRSLIGACRDIIAKSSDGELNARTVLDMAEQRIYEIRQGKEARGLRKISSIILETYDHLQRISGEDREKYLGVSSGFSAIDQMTTGLNKSDLILVAGRPGMGKTSFALNIAQNVAKRGRAVAVFSLEMSSEQLVSRLLASESQIPSQKFRTGEMSPEQWQRLAVNAQYLSASNMYIDDASGITVPEIKAKIRRVRGLGLVVIDYLQLMSSGRKTENRVQEVSEMTRNLKIMAKEFDVPVMVCSQLSRGPDSRNDHRPVLSDLRESGSIEQDADIVMFLYRDAYYNKESADQNIAECIISKNRHGETGTVKLEWNGQYTRFTSLEAFRDDG
ncbi:MAG: replicative DNA helicase [Oscillospiraceae bacterium]|jgi:replicative DNA helicase|nr:replicative DNA helicase [Oscillospiraceae bacterium]